MLLLFNKSNKNVIVKKLSVADGFWSRMKGLMWKKDLAEDEGLLLVPCNSVHSMFMRFPIDLLFLDRELKIIRIIERFKPWKATPIFRDCHQVVEIKAGVASKKGVTVKDELEVIKPNPCYVDRNKYKA